MDECLEEYTPMGCISGSGYLLIDAASSEYLPVLLWVSLLWDYLSFLGLFSLVHIYPCLLFYIQAPEYIPWFRIIFLRNLEIVT